jgi:phosphoribosylglycinamide formyltransferase-1
MNLIIFASGAGSNARSIINYFKGTSTEVKLIVTNNPEAGVINISKEENIPLLMWDSLTIDVLKGYNPDIIVLAGFIKKIPEDYISNFRIINIHPSLLPKYGGKGMYGMNVHNSVISNLETISGITIHYVNEHYDEGKVISQFMCEVTREDDCLSLSKKIHKLEHYWYPRVIEYLENII